LTSLGSLIYVPWRPIFDKKALETIKHIIGVNHTGRYNQQRLPVEFFYNGQNLDYLPNILKKYTFFHKAHDINQLRRVLRSDSIKRLEEIDLNGPFITTTI
jgi:hypothetical protein